MDQNTQLPPQAPLPPTQPVPPSPPPPPKHNSGILIGIFLLLLGMLAGLAISKTTILSGLRIPYLTAIPTPTLIPTPTPSPTPDPTADWKTYTNPVENFSFRYPSTWTIDIKGEMGDERKENITVGLTKNQAKISIYANMVGIGGLGQNYEGTAFIMDGNNLFLFRTTNTYDKTQMVGVTDSLTETLGVFKVGGKTYSITLSYPVSYSQTEASALETEFKQILSTFIFLNSNPVQNSLLCVNKELGIRLTLPNENWKCESNENPGAGWIKLTSPFFTIEMSSLGRGPYCGDGGPDPNCQTSKYNFGNLTFTLYKYKGENKEIFGGTSYGTKPWISIKWNNMETTDLTSAQQTELTTLLQSISAY